MRFKGKITLTVYLLAVSMLAVNAQSPIGSIKIMGNDRVLNLSVITVSDAINTGNGVVKVVLPENITGAAYLVPTTDPNASEVRIKTQYGIMAWKKSSTFMEAIGTAETEEAFSISFSDDGNLLVAGEYFQLNGGFIRDGLLMKCNANGELDWAETFGFNIGSETINCLHQTSDGGYIFTGNTGSYVLGGWDIWISKIDEDLNETWGGALGGPLQDYGRDVFEDDDGGFVLIGTIEGADGPDDDIYVKKLNAGGVSVWGWSYGQSTDDYGYSIIKDEVPGYVALGTTVNVDSGDYDIYLKRISATGTLGNGWFFGGRGGNDVGRKVVLSGDGHYVLSGYTDRFGFGEEDFYLTKRDTSGGYIWSYAYGWPGKDKLWSMIRTNDDGFIMVGESDSFGTNGLSDILVIKTDADGGYEWSWVAGGIGTEIGYSVVQDEQGYYYVAGIIKNVGAGLTDFLLLTIFPDGTNCISYTESGKDNLPSGSVNSTDFQIRRNTDIKMMKVVDESTPDSIKFMRADERPVRATETPGRDVLNPVVTIICN
jgi:hypothetical protein